MPFTIGYEPDEDIVTVTMKGRLNFKIAEQYSKEAVKLARQNNCSKFILDHSETDTQNGQFKIHASGEELQQFGFTNNDRIAIILANLNTKKDFYVQVSKNSRWGVIKYFNITGKEKARKWLLETE